MNAPEAVPFKAEGPQPLLRAIPEAADYPVAALGPLRRAVKATQGQTQAPVALAAGSALAAASLAVQAFADVETLAGERPVSLYLLSVARSGERKTTADRMMLAALHAYEREKMRGRGAEMLAWRNRQALWAGERGAILGQAKTHKGDSAGAAADLHELGAEPVAPASPDRLVTEPTFEGLTRKFIEGMPSLGLFSDEGGQFLGGHAMNSDNRQKSFAALNSLWDGSAIRRTRAGDGSVTLYGRRLALHLMVQPQAAMTLLGDPLATDMGLLARCLICQPASTIGTRISSMEKYDGEALGEFSERLTAILEAPMPIDDETRELKPRTLPLSAEARALLVAFSDTVERAQGGDGEFSTVTGAASKAAEQAARLAGVMALWHNLEALEVTGETMGGAITLAQFYLSEAVRLANAAAVSKKIDRAEKLRQWLLETWPEPEILTGDVVQRGPGRDLRETPAARAALEMLAGYGWLLALPVGTVIRGSARRESWRIVRARP